MNCDIQAQTLEELQAQLQSWDQPSYRAAQLLEWLYTHRATHWDAMTNLPKPLRERLARQFHWHTLKLIRKRGADDSTQKFLWSLQDGALIESVLIPANPALYGEPSDRHTLCVSTQVGCAYGCRFCASGLDGWKRNLDAAEIVEQFLAVERWHAARIVKTTVPPPIQSSAPGTKDQGPRTRDQGSRTKDKELRTTDQGLRTKESISEDSGCVIRPGPRSPDANVSRLINNLVIMGMGEPLANYDNLLRALRILNAPWGGGIGARKITISTSGLAPQIRKLADEPLQFRLAISLHGATDDVRNRIMPVNRKYSLKELTSACEFYQSRKDRMITLEYILIAGVNDGLDQVKPLAEFALRLNAKVNLIPYNRVDGLPWERPTEAIQEKFLEGLTRLKVTATLRREKGHDIDAACGQLRLRTEQELRNVPV